MKKAIIYTLLFSVGLAILLFTPFLKEAFETAYGTNGSEPSVSLQFLRLGILSGLFFLIMVVYQKAGNYDKHLN